MIPQTVSNCEVAIIGAGPAGLAAAEHLASAGHRVHIFERMPTPARKFLMAGKSGLNITHAEDLQKFIARYSAEARKLTSAIRSFSPEDIRVWAADLGVETFIGSSGRVFPTHYKASPLLRAWLARLNKMGINLHTRHKWVGWAGDRTELVFETPDGIKHTTAEATILALGGTSWPKLGSVGEWQADLRDRYVDLKPFQPANCGFEINWSPHFRDRFAGEPVKNCVLSACNCTTKGDFVVTKAGVEGSAIYQVSRAVREEIEQRGTAIITVDLTPDKTQDELCSRLIEPRKKRSLADHIRRKTGLRGVKSGLLREFLNPDEMRSPEKLASYIKALPLRIQSSRPIEEAISVAGGVSFGSLDDNLMLTALPGIFCAGEMVDWEAPTGGYLLTACLAQGKQAAAGVRTWLEDRRTISGVKPEGA